MHLKLKSRLLTQSTEMNEFMFFKSKSAPTILFQIPIQILKLTVLKSKSCLKIKFVSLLLGYM